MAVLDIFTPGRRFNRRDLATLYHHLGIDPATTLTDHNRRPMSLLDDRGVVKELG